MNKIELGDIWQLGKHQLIRADCTQADVVQDFLKGKPVELCIADPPYGVRYNSNNRHKHRSKVKESLSSTLLLNDHRTSWAMALSLSKAPVLYTWYPSFLPDLCIAAQREAGYFPRQNIVWLKNRFALSRSAYHNKHESCSYAVRADAKANWYGDRRQHTVWEESIPTPKERYHPTQKPVGLYKRPIENHTRKGQYVYDPFAGSGTVFDACEVTGRRALGVELCPKYCGRIIERWEALTGKTATYHSNIFFEN